MEERASKKPKWLGTQEAADLVGVTASTVLRWLHVGFRNRDGERVRLRAICVGYRFKTRRRWLREYLDAVAELKMPTPEGVAARIPESPAARRRRGERARQAALDRLDGKRR